VSDVLATHAGPQLAPQLAAAFAARGALVEARHETAFRAFHGFTEGAPELALDVYGTTLVVHDFAGAEGDRAVADLASEAASEAWPWLRTVLWKVRKAPSPEGRAGRVIRGDAAQLVRRVREGGLRYALAPGATKDAGLYLDTRALRAHLTATLADATVLNTFAYTGSLGVAACAAPARRVVHVDRSREALNLAKASYALNGLSVARRDFVTDDVFSFAGRLRRESVLFDAVIVDPPFFSETAAGRVDLVDGTARLLDKLRPLVADGGALIVVNNALFLSGAELSKTLEAACEGGFAEIERRIGVPDDCAGYPATRVRPLPADPAPWEHATKITILRVRRKDGRKAS
jgi:23S rRNA (cytosine1962-C5)-methyltransferase